jgi:hypothetical protein
VHTSKWTNVALEVSYVHVDTGGIEIKVEKVAAQAVAGTPNASQPAFALKSDPASTRQPHGNDDAHENDRQGLEESSAFHRQPSAVND